MTTKTCKNCGHEAIMHKDVYNKETEEVDNDIGRCLYVDCKCKKFEEDKLAYNRIKKPKKKFEEEKAEIEIVPGGFNIIQNPKNNSPQRASSNIGANVEVEGTPDGTTKSKRVTGVSSHTSGTFNLSEHRHWITGKENNKFIMIPEQDVKTFIKKLKENVVGYKIVSFDRIDKLAGEDLI